jgi:ANTAR domain
MTLSSDDILLPERAPEQQALEHQAPEHQALELGLSRAAAGLGANTLAVLALEARSFEIVHRRPGVGETYPLSAPFPCALELRLALENGPAPVSGKKPLARFLTSAVAPTSNSFLLVPWRARHNGITLVFGFETPEPASSSIPAHLAESVNLASLAAWSLNEIARLRAELRHANRSFAGRKMVDRAKALLQSEHSMDEQQAYEYLRRMSRQRRITLSQLAEDFLGAPRVP